jgi:hypothetical protein
MIKSRRMRWAGHIACIRENRNACMILVRNSERKRLLGRPRHGWEHYFKMYLREVTLGNMDWVLLAQDRDQWRALVYTIMNLWVP